MGTIDLHTHSRASDGALTPADLVDAAAARGVSVLALTDHDTLAGIEPACAAAEQHGICLIPGVEISVTWQRRTLHIVGLGVDTAAPGLLNGLAWLQRVRLQRAHDIAARLEHLGVTTAFTRAHDLAAGGQITRTHFARLLLEDGLARNMQQCFKRYLKPGKPAHRSVTWAALEQAIDWIHTAGGLAVLAHPHGYGMSGAWRRRMYAAFTHHGGDAAEVCCGNTNPRQNQDNAERARAHGLMGSIGSDFHSHAQHWLALGRLQSLPRGLTPVWEHAALAAAQT